MTILNCGMGLRSFVSQHGTQICTFGNTSLNNLTFFFIYLVQSQYFIINKQNLLFE